MNEEDQNALEAYEIIANQYSLPSVSELTKDEILRLLKNSLLKLLETDFQALVNLMYRLDVSEENFQSAMTGNDNGNIAQRLAGIVLEREIQRFMWKKKYSEK